MHPAKMVYMMELQAPAVALALAAAPAARRQRLRGQRASTPCLAVPVKQQSSPRHWVIDH